MKQKRYRQDVIYQIYPRSFCDSNGDGIGDIPGIISKLDYLADLGVGIIWLSPIYKSPLFDMGYDVADYLSIHPDYGTMEDFDHLLEEAGKRNIKIVMDLVVNHTSDEHPWFQASRDKNSPYRDYYIWRKGKGKNGELPPNNWTSQFTGPAWDYDEKSGEWYLHLFANKQPDLNWHNPKVLEEVEKIIRFYLDKGVYGFRCDVINQIYKDSLEDGKGHAQSGRGSEHYLMTEGNHRILRQIHEDVFAKMDDSVMIGETFNVDIPNGRRYLENKELDMFFQFDTMAVDKALQGAAKKRFRARNLRDVTYRFQKGVEWNANYLENHDQLRSISRFGDPKHHWKESGKSLACFNLCLRGTPFIYEGQEIGMLNLPPRDPRKSMDCAARQVYQILKKMPIPDFIRFKMTNLIDRDHERSPMQWNSGLSAGFSSSANTWLPVNENHSYINVEDEQKDPDSILNYYRKLIALRNKSIVLQEGAFEEVKVKGDLIAFKRVHEKGTVLVLVSLAKRALKVPSGIVPDKAELLLSTYGDSKLEGLTRLRPYESLIISL